MSTENNTPQSSETWRAALQKLWEREAGRYLINIEFFIAHELAEAERRGREQEYERLFMEVPWTLGKDALATLEEELNINQLTPTSMNEILKLYAEYKTAPKVCTCPKAEPGRIMLCNCYASNYLTTDIGLFLEWAYQQSLSNPN